MSNAQEMMLKSGTTKKFDIPIGHLDYEYINECTDVKELEKILKVLRSGDEGYYPEMERQCEERIKTLNPESRSLRKDKPLTTIGQLDRDERDTIETDLKSWTNEMIFADHDLQNNKSEFDNDSLPPIRSTGTLVNGQQSVTEQSTKSTKNKSVKPRTYAEWDKFDIDKELEKVDGGTDRSEKMTKTSPQSQPLIENFIDTSGMSESEKDRKANMEKEKGNEAFRSGDYKEAITYYSRSISLQPIAASYNNRALSYLKIEEWMKAETDCNKVLQLEPENIKALLRRGTAYKGKKEFSKALNDFQKALKLEPANKRAKDLIKELKKDEATHEEEQRKRKEKGRRMVIEEVDEDSSDDADEEIIVEEREEKVSAPKQSVKENMNAQQQQNSVNKNQKNTDSEKKMVNGFHEESEKKSKKDAKDIWESDEVSDGLDKKSEEEKQVQTKLSPANSPQPTQNANTEKKKSDKGKVDDLKHTLDKKDTAKVSNETSENVDGSEKPTAKNDVENEEKTVDSEMSDVKLDQKQEINDNVVNETKEAENSSLQRPVFIKHELPEDIAQMREAGNNLFRAGQYGEAIKKYTEVIGKLENFKTKEHVVNLSLIYSNRAACYLKTGDCPHAITDCQMSLELIPHAIKPLLRRAQAYETLERYSFAYKDFKHVLQIDSTVDMALQGSARCQRHLQDLNGARWREKLPPMTKVSMFEIPDILDNTGKHINTSVASNQSAPSSQDNIASNQSVKPSPSPPTTSKQPEVQNTAKSEPQLTKEQMFDKKKEEGNQFVKKTDYRQAIKCYSECIDLLPDRTVSYTNRALCYIRVNEPQEADSDCNKALSLEPDNVKALFRRAQAKKMLKKYKESLEDLTNLLKLDPRNSAAIRERDLVKNYWREELNALKTQMPDKKSNKTKESEAKTAKASKPRKRMVIQEVESDEEEGSKSSITTSKQKAPEDEQKSKKSESAKSGDQTKNTPEKQKIRPVETPSSVNEKSKKNQKASEKTKSKIQENTDDTVKQENPKSKTEVKPSASKKSATKNTKPTSMGFPTAAPSAPKLEKANPYEFIQAWNSIKSSKQIDPYADLIRQIPPSDIPKVISNKLDGQMLNIITSCVAEKFIPQGDLDLSYNILSNLCKVPRFGTIAMFLSPTEQKEIKSVFSRLQDTPSSAYNKEDLTRLRKEYNIK